VWDRPQTPISIALAASGPSSCELAGLYADGVVVVDPDPRLLHLFDEAGGTGKPRYGQVAVCYGPDEDECRKIVYEQWRWSGLGWKVNAELPGPESFASATQGVRPEDVARTVPCGPDIKAHVEAFKKYVDAGFTHVALVQVGGDSQPMFLDWAREELVPQLREL
jgi:G6PDH family F420-dependent oxidoreductase